MTLCLTFKLGVPRHYALEDCLIVPQVHVDFAAINDGLPTVVSEVGGVEVLPVLHGPIGIVQVAGSHPFVVA